MLNDVCVVWICCSILCIYFVQRKNKVYYTMYNLAPWEEQVQCYLYNSSSHLHDQGDHMWRSIRCVKSVFFISNYSLQSETNFMMNSIICNTSLYQLFQSSQYTIMISCFYLFHIWCFLWQLFTNYFFYWSATLSNHTIVDSWIRFLGWMWYGINSIKQFLVETNKDWLQLCLMAHFNAKRTPI